MKIKMNDQAFFRAWHLIILVLVFYFLPLVKIGAQEIKLGYIQSWIIYTRSKKPKVPILYVTNDSNKFKKWHDRFSKYSTTSFKKKWFNHFKSLDLYERKFKSEYENIVLKTSHENFISILLFDNDGMFLTQVSFFKDKYPNQRTLLNFKKRLKDYRKFKTKNTDQKRSKLFLYAFKSYQSKLYIGAINYANLVLRSSINKPLSPKYAKAAKTILKLTEGKLAQP